MLLRYNCFRSGHNYIFVTSQYFFLAVQAYFIRRNIQCCKVNEKNNEKITKKSVNEAFFQNETKTKTINLQLRKRNKKRNFSFSFRFKKNKFAPPFCSKIQFYCKLEIISKRLIRNAMIKVSALIAQQKIRNFPLKKTEK